jgi:hypothetical protein
MGIFLGGMSAVLLTWMACFSSHPLIEISLDRMECQQCYEHGIHVPIYNLKWGYLWIECEQCY